MKGIIAYFLVALAVTSVTVQNTRSYQYFCANKEFNASQLYFAGYRGIAGSPLLQRSLSAKEELIYILVKDYSNHFHLNENLHEGHKNDCHYQSIHRYLQHFEITTGLMKPGQGPAPDRPSNVSWNPLLVYHMFNRMQKLLVPLITWLDADSDTQHGLRKQIIDLLADIGLPTEEDLRLAIRSILRIQHVYDLHTLSMTNGWLDGFNTGVSLSAWDCNAIGELAQEDKKYAAAVEWFEAALNLSQPLFQSILPVSEDKLRANLEVSMARHDSVHMFDSGNEELYTEKLADNSDNRIRMRSHLARAWKGHTEKYYLDYNYYGVCSGKTQQSEVVKAKLFCYQETKAHPLWTINPLKVELLSLQPLLIIKYHNLIGDKIIQMIKSEASLSLTRSIIDSGKGWEISDHRTSLNTWIDDNSKAEFRLIPKIIEKITGLRVGQNSSSDPMQVACYSAGSHYTIHQDANCPQYFNTHKDDRIATFLLYLSDVVKGGETAFPQSQLRLFPERGSAVLWYNLQKSGKADEMTWHGSCPVVLGEKCIANKWVRINDQMFSPNCKCGRDPNEKIGFNVNGRPVSDFY